MKTTKRALFSSLLALVLCFAMLLGTTYAWFTDSVTSAGNKIVAGTLDVEMYWADGAKEVPAVGSADWTDASTGAIFDYAYWEPGYAVARHVRIANEGSLALKYQLKISANGEVSKLADVIDVYYVDPAEKVEGHAALTAANKLGTLTEVLAGMNTSAAGNLEAGKADTVTLVLKMQESAGNEYQGLEIGSSFSIILVATQDTVENDSFGNDYDKDAPLPNLIASSNDLKAALANKVENITIDGDIVTNAPFTVDYNVTINGNGKTISRANGFTGNVFDVKANASLTLENVTVDGGAVWTSTFASNGALTNSGVTATGALVIAGNNAAIVLEEGAILQNNDGVNAVNLTALTSTLTINGGEIIYNRSGAGAIWCKGQITLNEGKINNNMSTGIGGAIRMATGGKFTMNGGEMSYNTAATSGGAVYAYNSTFAVTGGEICYNTAENGGAIYGFGSTFNLSGGKMSYNTASSLGGAMNPTYGSAINISGDFEMCNNTAAYGGAFRSESNVGLNMSGGKISGNISTQEPAWSGFYGWNLAFSFTGGVITDNIVIQGGYTHYLGGGEITGEMTLHVSTNHNTINLVKDFNTFKFRVNEAASNFAAFHFQPADGYTYTHGDEAKLVCLNEGYETYWDTTTNTFRLRAK